jgi:hypothetical protein
VRGGLGQSGLQITDDRADFAGGEEARPERTGRVLTNVRER